MSDETLLDKSLCNMELVDYMLERKTDDDRFLNFIAYHLQQAIELAIKHFLETNAVRYPKSHDIQELLDLLPEDCRIFDNIEPYADTITLMESKTRYIKNYQSSKKKVMLVYTIFKGILEDLKNELNKIEAFD